MKYTINDHELDCLERTLTFEGKQQKVRPKTLEMLMFLISHQGQIIAKSQLLEEIWHDTTVNEGVVFQSITEIRKLFNNNNLIINHPRRGYQFIADVSLEVGISDPSKVSTAQRPTGIKWLLAVILITALAFLALFQFQAKTTDTPPKVLIMPADNQIRYESAAWLSLGAMDYLIRQLRDHSSLYVFSVEEVLHFLTQINSAQAVNTEGVKDLFDASNASHIVSVTVRGESPDYKLAVTIYDKTSSYPTVILSESIENALHQTSLSLAQHFQVDSVDPSYEPDKAFKNSLFSKAIMSYETDWDTSIHYLKSYLDLEPDSLLAMHYLAKLMVWQNDIDAAEHLLNRLETRVSSNSRELARIYYLKGLIAKKSGKPELALPWFERASEVIKHHSFSILNVRLIDSTGGVLMNMGQYQLAIAKFHTALTLYQSVKNVVGINSIKLQLARAYQLTGDEQLSKTYLAEAEIQISELEIEFLQRVLQDTKDNLVNIPST